MLLVVLLTTVATALAPVPVLVGRAGRANTALTARNIGLALRCRKTSLSTALRLRNVGLRAAEAAAAVARRSARRADFTTQGRWL